MSKLDRVRCRGPVGRTGRDEGDCVDETLCSSAGSATGGLCDASGNAEGGGLRTVRRGPGGAFIISLRGHSPNGDSSAGRDAVRQGTGLDSGREADGSGRRGPRSGAIQVDCMCSGYSEGIVNDTWRVFCSIDWPAVTAGMGGTGFSAASTAIGEPRYSI